MCLRILVIIEVDEALRGLKAPTKKGRSPTRKFEEL